MENHGQREEIQEALTLGKGQAARYSDTLSQQTLYAAQRLADGTVLRVSSTSTLSGCWCCRRCSRWP